MTILGALMGFLLFSGSTVALPARAAAPAAPIVTPSYAVTLTAYNAVSEQTDDDPLITSSGAYSNTEIVAARSQNFAKELPFGTIIKIDGSNASKEKCGYDIVAPIIGYRVIADTMNARYTDRIDVLFDTASNYVRADGSVKNAGTILGICKDVTISVVGYVDINHMPKTQAALAEIVEGKGDLALR